MSLRYTISECPLGHVKLVLSASLKIFQECFRIFQNDLETRLLLSVLNRYLNWWQRKYTNKNCFKIICLAISNREEPKKTKIIA